jgi:hypothetical protein
LTLYTAGQKIRASELNQLPQLYYLNSDLARTTSASYASVTGLSFAVDISSRYLAECFLFYNAPTAAGIKVQWTFPAATTASWGADGVTFGAASSVGSVNRQSLGAAGEHAFSGETGIDVFAKPTAVFLTSTTAGTIQLQFKQQATSGTTTLRAGSCLRVTKLV